MKSTKIALFQGKKVRKVLHQNEWWFSVIDVIEILTDSSIPRRYWVDLKRKLENEGYFQLYENIVQLKLIANDGKKYATDCANTETMLRVIQSIPSPKVEPLKRWLASVGAERIDEVQNPEIAMNRMKVIYEQKGYPKDWIDKRVRGIAVRQSLTDEWNKRGAGGSLDYAILTNEIMHGTFGMRVDEYKKFKRLQRENLRDHMDDIELILTMLGEATTTKFAQDRKSQGMPKLTKDAQDGGAVAGRTRKDIERQSGKKVSTRKNFLNNKKRLSR